MTFTKGQHLTVTGDSDRYLHTCREGTEVEVLFTDERDCLVREVVHPEHLTWWVGNNDLVPMDGTSGQDRESYTDEQDRDSYTVEV